jgi:hypothetical protein
VPEFQTASREARRSAFGQSIARLQQGTSAAATTLLKLLIEPNTPASVRARVADSIFNHAAKAIEIEEIEERLSNLERPAGLPGAPGSTAAMCRSPTKSYGRHRTIPIRMTDLLACLA